MRTFRLNKLVRDGVVSSTIEEGGSVQSRQLKGVELLTALINKIPEEGREIDPRSVSAEELADVMDVVEAIAAHAGFTPQDIATAQNQKREANGGFDDGMYVETVTLPADNKWAEYYASNPERFPEIKE